MLVFYVYDNNKGENNHFARFKMEWSKGEKLNIIKTMVLFVCLADK